MQHHSLFNAIQAHSSCQRRSGSLEAPQRCTKSAKRRKRGGRRTGRRRKVEARFWCYSPPTWNLALILAALFLAHHKISNLKTQTWIQMGMIVFAPVLQRSTPFCTVFSLYSFPSSHPPHQPLLLAPPYLLTPPQHQAWLLSASHVNEIVSRSKGMERNF